MGHAFAASVLDALLGSTLGPLAPDARDRLSVEDLSWQPGDAGTLRFAIGELETSSLRLAFGPFVLQVGGLALQRIAGVLRVQEGRLSLEALEAESARLSGTKAEGPLDLGSASKPQRAPSAGKAWCLDPLAAANGTIRAQIVDAHLLFDAGVTVPIQEGQIDFGDATVEHVGPDSRMGVSRLGLYVDAPNGRSYLYQFAAAAVDGVDFERRGALLGPWVTDRGSLRLQPFGEGLLRQGPAGAGQGFTAQARELLARTALSGEVRLGDGRFCIPGLEGQLAGRAEGRNKVRLHSESVGRGLVADVEALRVRGAVLQAGSAQWSCDEISAAVAPRVSVEQQRLRVALEVREMTVSGLRL